MLFLLVVLAIWSLGVLDVFGGVVSRQSVEKIKSRIHGMTCSITNPRRLDSSWLKITRAVQATADSDFEGNPWFTCNYCSPVRE